MPTDWTHHTQFWDAVSQTEETDYDDEKINRLLRWKALENYLPGVNSILDIGADGEVGSPEPQKYMIYELHRARTGWYLYAVKDLPGATLLTGSDAMLPTELPISSLPQSDVVPEVAGNAQDAASAGQSEAEDGSSDEGASSEGEAAGEDGGTEEGQDGESEASQAESAPELQG